jgi:hypothetical protein
VGETARGGKGGGGKKNTKRVHLSTIELEKFFVICANMSSTKKYEINRTRKRCVAGKDERSPRSSSFLHAGRKVMLICHIFTY